MAYHLDNYYECCCPGHPSPPCVFCMEQSNNEQQEKFDTNKIVFSGECTCPNDMCDPCDYCVLEEEGFKMDIKLAKEDPKDDNHKEEKTDDDLRDDIFRGIFGD